mmetsp:Transcript_11668/g.45415  ORF Transcript_11668/g.45415 Transcript_11668/m.45415 type:complete len:307 (+) Transcript_11668:1398-2318(+)
MSASALSLSSWALAPSAGGRARPARRCDAAAVIRASSTAALASLASCCSCQMAKESRRMRGMLKRSGPKSFHMMNPPRHAVWVVQYATKADLTPSTSPRRGRRATATAVMIGSARSARKASRHLDGLALMSARPRPKCSGSEYTRRIAVTMLGRYATMPTTPKTRACSGANTTAMRVEMANQSMRISNGSGHALCLLGRWSPSQKRNWKTPCEIARKNTSDCLKKSEQGPVTPDVRSLRVWKGVVRCTWATSVRLIMYVRVMTKLSMPRPAATGPRTSRTRRAMGARMKKRTRTLQPTRLLMLMAT